MEAINHPEVGLAISAVNSISNKVDNVVNSLTNSDSASSLLGESGLDLEGSFGIISQANNVIDRLQKVVNPPPIGKSNF